MSIRLKIVFVLLLLTIPSILASRETLFQLNKISEPVNNEIPKQVESLIISSELESFSQQIIYYDEVLTQAARNYAFTGTKKWKNIYIENSPKLDEIIKQSIEKGHEEDRKYFKEIDEANLALVEMEKKSINLVDKGMLQEAIRILDGTEYWAQKEIYISGIKKFYEGTHDHYYESSSDAISSLHLVSKQTQEIIDQGKKIIISSSIAYLLIAIMIGIVLAYFITKPIIDLKHGMEVFRKGDFSYKIKTNSKDEIGQLSREFNKMTEAIKQSRKDVDKKVEEQTKDIVKKAQDIEDQRKALMNVLEDMEEINLDLSKFKMAVENASDHIVITDTEGIILYANKSVATITGFESSFVIGKKAGNKELWGGLMDVDFYKKLWKTIKEEKKVFSGEINNCRKNGENYVAMASISPVFDNDGKIIYFVGIERDITKAKEVDKMKTEFISLASHQLRTPLTAIKWYIEMMVNGDGGKLNKEQTEFAENIQKSNERMIELVNSLLNISRIESGRIIIDPQATDVNELVSEAIKDLEIKLKEKKINIVTSIHKKLPLIKMDPKLIRNVLMNLLSNSIKYSCDGCEVIVMVSKDDKDVTFQISDNGFGIPKNEQDKVFEKFYRGENVVKKVTDGNGLGLYLVKAIVESSGGKIWFKSEEDKGTTFYFSLPLAGVKAKAGEVVIDG